VQADPIGDEWFIARHARPELHADDGSQTTPIHTLTRSVEVQWTRYSFVSTSQPKEIHERLARYAERRKDIDWIYVDAATANVWANSSYTGHLSGRPRGKFCATPIPLMHFCH